MEFLQNILERDKELFLFLNSLHNDFWDTIMLLVTRQETWIPFFAIILYFIIKNYRSKAVLIIIGIALVILAADQLAGVMKYGFQRFRPTHEPSIAAIVHNVLTRGGKYGFVSAHAANSTAILVFTSRIFKRRSYYFLMLTWTILFCYSRIYTGVHYPLDIIGGVLLGWSIGFLLYKLVMLIENHFFYSKSPKIRKTRLPKRQIGTIYFVFFVLVATVLIVTNLLHSYNYL